MHKCTAQEALRNAPFCIKYELLYSHAKSRDRFIAATLSFWACSLRLGEGHMVSLRVTWSRFGKKTNQLNAIWGSESPFSTTILNIYKSRERWKKTNKACRSPTPFYPPALPALWKTSFISVQEWRLINNYALPSLYVSLSLSVSPLQPFLPHFLDGLPKEIKKNISFALPIWPGCRSWKYNLWGLKKWRWHFVGIFVVNDLRKLLRGERVRNKGNMMLWINVCMHVQNVCGRLTMNGTRKFFHLLP